MITGPEAAAFALVRRPHSAGTDEVEILVGEMSTVDVIAELPLPDLTPVDTPTHDLLAIMPFRQITERGFACYDDQSPLLAMTVRAQGTASVDEVLRHVPDIPIDLRDGDFDIDDESYATVVRQVLANEIGRGTGSNFVIKRSFTGEVANCSRETVLALFRRLLVQELGAYWTFVVHTGDRTFVGATPERHVSLDDGTVTMNPISGTYRYPAEGPVLPEVLRFLADPKEADELYMVVDEELKMMGRVCDQGGRVVGPYLKEMARLAHTEYLLEGRSSLDVREIMRETMFAPTVTGSPLQSACQVISRYERTGRGYYSGVLALVGREAQRRTLDSAILIRTAEIDRTGGLRIGVGATLVRHSDADSEVAETRAKAAGLLAALGAVPAPEVGAGTTGSRPALFGTHPAVRHALEARNTRLARFWLDHRATDADRAPDLVDRRILVIDAEDTFTSMLAHQIRSLGPAVDVRRFDEEHDPDGYDLVVVGPGPGDPRDVHHRKIGALRRSTAHLLARGTPLLSICLGHQVLGSLLGFELVRRGVPNQGVQLDIDYFGRTRTVGFYNTFMLRCESDQVYRPELVPGVVRVSRDPATGEVYGLRGRGFASLQFHPESVLTQDGPQVLNDLISTLLPARTVAA
ncbi:anthranilate synthase family protein [Micromonospora pisi]|nr:anthranilate synthase family protein [Micromonospora pisi]